MAGGKVFPFDSMGRCALHSGQKLPIAVHQILRQRGFTRWFRSERGMRRALLFDADKQRCPVFFAANRLHACSGDSRYLFEFVLQIAFGPRQRAIGLNTGRRFNCGWR